MSKRLPKKPAGPPDIPQDVLDAAWADYFDRCDSVSKLAARFEEHEVIDLLCRARMAERERCADIADSTVGSIGVGGGEFYIADQIAAAIRRGAA